MNKKHLLGAISGFAIATLLTSKVVFASCINYNLYIPETGEVKSGQITKQTNSAYGTNIVTYFGWPGSKVISWIYCPHYQKNVTPSVTVTGTGTYKLYYKAKEFDTKGKKVQMRFKTSALTLHACDIRGTFHPDGK